MFTFFVVLLVLLVLLVDPLVGKKSVDHLNKWGRTAYKLCAKELKKLNRMVEKGEELPPFAEGDDGVVSEKEPTLALCEEFQDLVEDVLDKQSTMMGNAVDKSASQLFVTSQEPYFKMVGEQILQQTAWWALRKRIHDESRIRKRLSSQFGGWMLKVAAEDKNMQNIGVIPPEMEKDF